MPALTHSPYRQLFQDRGRALLMLVGAVAKLPPAMLSLALVLAITDTVGRSTAGWCAMTMSLGLAVTSPWRGRIVDRHGPRATLFLLGAAEFVLLLALWFANTLAWAPPALVALSGGIGATTPPVAPVLRTVWSRATDTPAQAHAAHSWESVSIDLAYVLAPSLVALVAGLSAPAALLPMVAGLVIITSGIVGIQAGHSWSRDANDDGGITHPRLPVDAWRVIAAGALTSSAIVTVELGVVAAAESAGSLALSGVMIALISVGSIIGGLAYGHHAPRGSKWRHFTVAALLWVAGCSAAAATTTHLILLGAALTLAGLGFAVLMTVQYELAGTFSPPGRATETFSWMTTSGQLGAAAGAALGAQVAPGLAFALAAAAVATATLTLPKAVPGQDAHTSAE